MRFDIIVQIWKAAAKQMRTITKKLTGALKLLSKPFVTFGAYVQAQVQAMLRKPSTKADYVKIFGIYLSKRFLCVSVMGVASAAALFRTTVYPWLEGRLWKPVILLNSEKMAAYTGPAKICNEMGVVIYDGDVSGGALTGTASQYDTDGKLVYTGDFVNASYNGSGSVYEDGIVRYTGSFVDNLYQGEGELYDKGGALIYRGQFDQGLRSGRGMEYRPDTHKLSYFGDFSNGLREGSGIAYEEDGTTVKYRGSFLTGLYDGQGSYYENGALIYEGGFSRGLFEGSGTLYDGKGNVIYEGEFSRGSRQGAGTVYDALGSALYTGEFLDGSVHYIGYLGAAPEDIRAAFGKPSFTTEQNGWKVLTYLNLGASFMCTDASGTSAYACDHILVDTAEHFLDIGTDSTEREIEVLLGQRFSSLILELSPERKLAAGQLSLALPEQCRVDKYLMSNYFIKIYYDSTDTKPAAVECGSY